MACAASLRQLDASPAGSPSITLPQQAILNGLQQQPGFTVSQLARRRGTSRQNTQVMVDRLAEAGFVRYVANPDHRRSERLQLTETGRRALSSSRRNQAAWLSGLQTEVSADQVRSCLELLQSIRARLSGRQPASLPITDRPRRSGRRKNASVPAVSMEHIIEPAEEPMLDTSPPEELPVSLL